MTVYFLKLFKVRAYTADPIRSSLIVLLRAGTLNQALERSHLSLSGPELAPFYVGCLGFEGPVPSTHLDKGGRALRY